MDTILSGDPFRRVSALWDKAQQAYRSSFADLGGSLTFLMQMHRLGFTKLAGVFEPPFRKMLGQLQVDFPFEIVPVVPNMDRHSRLSQNLGIFGAGKHLLLELPRRALLPAALRAVRLGPGVLRNEFPAMVSLLAAIDLFQLRHLLTPLVLLHPTVVDLLVANHQERLLQRLVDDLVKVAGTPVGVMTENLGAILKLVEVGSLAPAAVAGPLNRWGYRVRPSLDEVFILTRRSPVPILATLVSSTSPPFKEDLEFLSASGARGMIVEIPDAKAAFGLARVLDRAIEG